MRVAIFDMGTNVYNLLLAEVEQGHWNTIRVAKQAARLGDGGLSGGMLTPKAFETAATAMQALMRQLYLWGGAEQCYAYATSAVRDAKNGAAFTAYLKEKFGLYIQVISGDREAELIYKGICSGARLTETPVLMLDIGGGSVEFIIGNAHEIYWKHSFPLGMARLLERFRPSDPIKKEEIAAITTYLEEELALLWQAIGRYKPDSLIGSSGSFDSYRAILSHAEEEEADTPSYPIDPGAFRNLHNSLLSLTTAERLQIKGLSPIRADFIVPAVLLTQLVIDKIAARSIMQCSYSLKEGAASELSHL